MMSSENMKKKKEEETETESESTHQHETTHLSPNPDIKKKFLNHDKEKVLQGKTLQIYWYILTHNQAGVREIQKALKISSPGTVSYQINKLLKTGIISKNKKNGKYYVNEEIKKGVLGFYTRIGFIILPRFSLYLIINIFGFMAYLIFAIIYGDKFITNIGSILLLFFLVFGTAVFIFESIKIWKRRPTKSN